MAAVILLIAQLVRLHVEILEAPEKVLVKLFMVKATKLTSSFNASILGQNLFLTDLLFVK